MERNYALPSFCFLCPLFLSGLFLFLKKGQTAVPMKSMTTLSGEGVHLATDVIFTLHSL